MPGISLRKRPPLTWNFQTQQCFRPLKAKNGIWNIFFKKLHFGKGQIGKWQFEIFLFLNFYSWQHWNPRAEVSFSFPSFFFFSLLKSVNVFLKQILKYPHFLTHERCTLVTVKKLMPSPRLPWSNLKSRAYILQCCQLWKQKLSKFFLFGIFEPFLKRSRIDYVRKVASAANFSYWPMSYSHFSVKLGVGNTDFWRCRVGRIGFNEPPI